MTIGFRIALAACAAIHALAGGAAHAQLFRAYLASTGSDANPCSVAAPCRLLPAAIAAVGDGGEVWMLDSANYNTGQVNIAKSVTILAIPGAVGSLVAVEFNHAIDVVAPGVRVVLRNLVVRRLTGTGRGLNFNNGAELEVSGCEFVGLQAEAIHVAAAGARVTIRDSVVRGTSGAGLRVDAATATLERVRLQSNTYGVYVTGGGRVTIDDSVLAGNTFGAVADGTSGLARLVMERSVVTGNATGLSAATTSSATGTVQVSLRANTFTHNTGSAVAAQQDTTHTVTVVIDGNVFARNQIGVSSFGATVYTRDNNTARFNVFDALGDPLQPLAAQ